MKVFIVLLLVAGAVESITALVLPDCYKVPETGPCRGSFPRYYYDQKAGQCKAFIYGGCGGNGNNFETEDECYNQCGVCGDNERYSGCGTDCPLTCKNYDDPPKICTLSCRIGCECEEGFVRSADGKCVMPEQCPNRQVQCGQNAHYEGCGTECPLTCENYDDPPDFCRASCVKGCQCDEGFVKAENGSCVEPEDCPVKGNDELCGENERYNECGTDCPLTCENYDNPPEFCNSLCWIGCECEKGFVRSADGTCVRPDQCPNGQVKCGENAHYEECGKPCPQTCDNYDNPPKFCPASCVSGCQCNKGFVKKENGSCVEPEDCPVKRNDEVCGENERYSECATACPLTCENYENPPKICPAFCRIGCECEKGFIRSQGGRCVRPEECTNRQVTQNECSGPPLTGPCRTFITRFHYDPSTDKCKNFTYGGCRGNKNNFKSKAECNGKCREKCGENEHFVVCRRRCPLTCGNYENPPACVTICAAGGCQCKEGFVRTKNGSCVKPEKCPVKRNHCPSNKEYGSFGDCPDSCYSLEHPVRACTLRLNWGCKCKPGYVLKEDKVFESECIKPEECPKDACNE